MTVGELGDRMTSAELAEWIAHDDLTAFEREQARKEQEMMAKVRGGH